MPDAKPSNYVGIAKPSTQHCRGCGGYNVTYTKVMAYDGSIVITYSCRACKQVWAHAPYELVKAGMCRPSCTGVTFYD